MMWLFRHKNTEVDHIGIPKILQPEDLVAKTQDELSIITYLSYYPKYVSSPSIYSFNLLQSINTNISWYAIIDFF